MATPHQRGALLTSVMTAHKAGILAPSPIILMPHCSTFIKSSTLPIKVKGSVNQWGLTTDSPAPAPQRWALLCPRTMQCREATTLDPRLTGSSTACPRSVLFVCFDLSTLQIIAALAINRHGPAQPGSDTDVQELYRNTPRDRTHYRRGRGPTSPEDSATLACWCRSSVFDRER